MKAYSGSSTPPLLPTTLSSLPASRGVIPRYARLAVAIGLCFVTAQVAIQPHRLVFRPTSSRDHLDMDVPCEARGLVTRFDDVEQEKHRVAVRIRGVRDPKPITEEEARTISTDNSIRSASFHPYLSSLHSTFFPSDSLPKPRRKSFSHRSSGECISPISHTLPHLAPPPALETDPVLFFAMCTTPKRILSQFLPIWSHYLSRPADTFGTRFGGESWSETPQLRGPGCLVANAGVGGDTEGMKEVNEALEAAGMECRMMDSSTPEVRYEMKVLRLVKDAWTESERIRHHGGPKPEWFVIGDDDTYWVDKKILYQRLAKFDHNAKHLLGTFSESEGTIENFGTIAFGGGGIILSRGLMRHMQTIIDDCGETYSHIFGGDGLISHCAAEAKGVNLTDVVEIVPGLNQMDMRGDASGFLTSGRLPFLTLHHWAGWLELIPDQSGPDTIRLFSQVIDAVGGQNFLRRFVYDGGKTLFTLGHSIIMHKEALSPDFLERAEHTWTEHQPREPSRSPMIEGEEKMSYYLTSVVPLSPTLTVFRHTCTTPNVSSTVREIDVVWDSSESLTFESKRAWWRPWTSLTPDSVRGRSTRLDLSFQKGAVQALRQTKW